MKISRFNMVAIQRDIRDHYLSEFQKNVPFEIIIAVFTHLKLRVSVEIDPVHNILIAEIYENANKNK